jgi:hypothetical protein
MHFVPPAKNMHFVSLLGPLELGARHHRGAGRAGVAAARAPLVGPERVDCGKGSC